MIGIIVVMIVFIVLGIMATIQNNKRNKRITELEDRLEEYYNKRENRLLKRFKDIEQQ